MANKKVYYYTFEVSSGNERRNLLPQEIRNLVNGIFNENCVNSNNLTHLVLNPEATVLERVTMDIISNDENYLFGRIGKYKDNSESLFRNINTYEVSDVGNDEMFLEIYTYFILDYSYNIIGYINGRSAPNAFQLEGIINSYQEEYTMSLSNIVSGETVRALNTPGATISKIEYTYRVPDIRILAHLGLNREEVLELQETEYKTVDISIKNERRKSLTGDSPIIDRLIDAFSRNNNLEKKRFKGKVPNSSSQEYGFEMENYSTKIDVPITRVENGNLIRYSLEEIAEQIIARLRAGYLANRRHILRFANINE